MVSGGPGGEPVGGQSAGSRRSVSSQSAVSRRSVVDDHPSAISCQRIMMEMGAFIDLLIGQRKTETADGS